MQSGHKINSKLVEALNENIKNPFLILDENWNILSFNNEAKTLLSIKKRTKNLFDVFDEASFDKINPILQKIIESQTPQTEYIGIRLTSGEKIKAQLILNFYQEEAENFIFCTIKQEDFSISQKPPTNVKVQTNDIKELIDDENLLKVFENIKSLYPFTFIGKERLRKEVDTLDEIFWLKDSSGNYILVNNKMAKSLGMNRTQIEGKKEESFIPAYLIEFHKSIENYIKNSANSVVLQGVPLKGISSFEKFQTIEIPLVDVDKNVIAVIGFVKKAEVFSVLKDGIDSKVVDDKIIRELPKAICIIDNRGVIKHSSKEFCKLFSEEFADISDIEYWKIFPLKISEEIKNFYETDYKEKTLEIKNENVIEKFSNDILLHLNKTYNNEENFSGIVLLIEEKESEIDFESLFKKRGPMFDILIKNNPQPIFIYDRENLKFLEVNDAALKLYGYSRDEFLQMDLTDLYTPEDIQSLLDSAENKIKEGSYSGPFKHKRKNGSSVFVEISKFSTNFEGNEAHFNLIKDITEQLDLEKKNQLFKASFDNTNNLLFVTDSSGFIQFVNNAVSDNLGYNKDEIKQNSFASIVKDEERGIINTTIFQSHIKETITLNVELKNSSGNLVEVELTATPIFDYKNDVESFNIMASVIKEDTESEIKEIIKEVPVEKTSYETDDKTELPGVNPEFFSNVFHEILTPINVILGFVQELTGDEENLSPEQKEASRIINQNRSSLLNTMNSVMEFSSLQKDSDIKPKEVAITEIIDKLQEDIREITGTRDLEFAYGKISSSLRFITDKNKFQTFSSDLLKISSQITKENKIYFSSYLIDDDKFIVSVKDSYSAISNVMLYNLNLIFGKEKDSKTKDVGVSRLTINLAKKLLNLLKGDFKIYEKDDGKRDCGFIFPVDVTQFIDDKVEEESTAEQPQEKEETVETEIPEDTSSDTETFEEIPISFKEPSEEESLGDEQKSNEDEIDMESEEEFPEEPEKFKEPEEFEETELNAPEDQIQNTEDDRTYEEKTEEDVFEGGQEEEPEVEFEDHSGLIEEDFIMPVEDQEFEQDETDDFGEISEEDEFEEEPEVERRKKESDKKFQGKINLSQLNCLYIEDQVDSQILFKVQMKELNDIKFAVSFEEALPLLDSHNFDFIVMDINLQGEYNGLDALKIIHKMPDYENIPIIAVTAYVLPGDKEKFIAAGFNDFISKPIFREKMVDSLEKIFLIEY